MYEESKELPALTFEPKPKPEFKLPPSNPFTLPYLLRARKKVREPHTKYWRTTFSRIFDREDFSSIRDDESLDVSEIDTSKFQGGFEDKMSSTEACNILGLTEEYIYPLNRSNLHLVKEQIPRRFKQHTEE